MPEAVMGVNMVLRNITFLLILAVLLLGGWFFILSAMVLALPLAFILYQFRIQDSYVNMYLVDKFKKKLGLRASMKAASFDFLDDWSHASVTLQNLTLHNPDGFSDSIMATIEYIKVEFLPLTMLTPCLEIRRMTVQGVDAFLERVDGKLNTASVALKQGEDPRGGAVVVWSDDSEESDSSDDDSDMVEGGGLQFGKVGRAAAGKAVQVATAVPRAAVTMAGSAVKRGVRAVAAKDRIKELITKGRDMIQKRKDTNALKDFTGDPSSRTNSWEADDVSPPESAQDEISVGASESCIELDEGDEMNVQELEELWMSDVYNPKVEEIEEAVSKIQDALSKGAMPQAGGEGRKGRFSTILNRLKSTSFSNNLKKVKSSEQKQQGFQSSTASFGPASSSDSLNGCGSEKSSPVVQVAPAASKRNVISCRESSSPVVQVAPAATKLPSIGHDKGAIASLEQVHVAVVELPPAVASERTSAAPVEKLPGTGFSRYRERLGDLSRVAVRTLRRQALTETPYPEIPGQRFACVEKVVISNVRLHVTKLLNAVHQHHNQEVSGLSDSESPDSAPPKNDAQPLQMSYIAIEEDDFKPCSTAIRQDGIPPKELARRIKIRVRGAIRRQNRAAMVRLSAARGMEWLRTRVGSRNVPNAPNVRKRWISGPFSGSTENLSNSITEDAQEDAHDDDDDDENGVPHQMI